jgi:5,10-methylene-tetrahydrofolate dehydrogenase/methenyl tetrahydrofolate cyclohydrolase
VRAFLLFLQQLPKHIDEQLVLSAISVEKDVDGFHPLNMGRLCMKVSRVQLWAVQVSTVQDSTSCYKLTPSAEGGS